MTDFHPAFFIPNPKSNSNYLSRMQFQRLMEQQTETLNNLSEKRARAHEVMRAEARDLMLRASSDRERDDIKRDYERRHRLIDSETEER